MVDSIILKSEILEVTKINRKTKAKMFVNLKIGDRIKFWVPIKRAGSNGGTYATYIKAENINTGEKTCGSFNQLPSILNCFEFDYVVADDRSYMGNLREKVYIDYIVDRLKILYPNIKFVAYFDQEESEWIIQHNYDKHMVDGQFCEFCGHLIKEYFHSNNFFNFYFEYKEDNKDEM